jgi:uncharacterized membrane protein
MIEHDVRARRGAPLHPGLTAIGSSILIAVFVTDLIYWQTLLFQWNNFSSWLLVIGLICAGLAAVAFIVDVATRRLAGIDWLRFAALAAAALLSILNAFVHSRDAYTAVVPEGIILSAVVALLLVAASLGGWSLEARGTSTFRRQDITS